MANILVVDDSISMRNMVSFTLRSERYETVEAENGQDALAKAQKGNFDLIISDVNMPIMDGITFCQEVRKLSAYRFTPILILTTESSSDMKAKGKAAGATGWLVKPFSPDALISTIKRVIR